MRRSVPALVALVAALPSVPATARGAEWDRPGWVLTFHDEFDGTGVDAAKWVKRYKWGEAQINGELQAYVDDAFQVQGGVLAIRGEKRTGSYAGRSFAYTSGVLCSVHEQTYGLFEARLRVPAGRGLWPAFWLLHANGTPDVNEIDVLEILGHQPNVVYMTNHWGTSYATDHFSDGSSWTGPDFSAEFHTFAVEWSPDAIVWTIDGVERKRHTGPGIPRVPMYAIVNLAIGGGWPGAPDDSTPFPATYAVDWVRVYAREGGTGPVPPQGSCASGGAATLSALAAAAAALALRRRRR